MEAKDGSLLTYQRPETKNDLLVLHWRMQPVILQLSSGVAEIYVRVQITAASDSLMPHAIDLRIDNTLMTITTLRDTRDDFWVDAHNFGTKAVEFSIKDKSVIERIAKSKDAWMIGYTRYGNHLRRSIEIPPSWKEALSLMLSKYSELTTDIPSSDRQQR